MGKKIDREKLDQLVLNQEQRVEKLEARYELMETQQLQLLADMRRVVSVVEALEVHQAARHAGDDTGYKSPP